MTIQIGEIIRGVISYSVINSSIPQNVFTWEVQDAAVDETDLLDDLENWCETEWGDNWKILASTAAAMLLLEVDVLNGDGTVNRNIGAEILVKVGINATELSSSGVAGYIQAESERTKSLGKKYLPGMAEGSIAQGVFTAAGVGVLVDILAEYVSPITLTVAGTLVPGVLSRVTETFQEFTGSGYSTDVPAYQRRRKDGVGS